MFLSDFRDRNCLHCSPFFQATIHKQGNLLKTRVFSNHCLWEFYQSLKSGFGDKIKQMSEFEIDFQKAIDWIKIVVRFLVLPAE